MSVDEEDYKDALGQSRSQLDNYVQMELKTLSDKDQLDCLRIVSESVEHQYLIQKPTVVMVHFDNISDKTMRDLYIHIKKCTRLNTQRMKNITDISPTEKSSA